MCRPTCATYGRLLNGAPYGVSHIPGAGVQVVRHMVASAGVVSLLVCWVVASVQVKRAIDEEESRCRSYLPDVTRIVVINTCRTVFLTGHHGTIVRKYASAVPVASRRDGVLAVLPVSLPSSRPAYPLCCSSPSGRVAA